MPLCVSNGCSCLCDSFFRKEDVEKLDVDGVVNFAQQLELPAKALQVLRDQAIRGKILHRMTAEKLMGYGMTGGPAEEFMEALDEIFRPPNEGVTCVPSSIFLLPCCSALLSSALLCPLTLCFLVLTIRCVLWLCSPPV